MQPAKKALLLGFEVCVSPSCVKRPSIAQRIEPSTVVANGSPFPMRREGRGHSKGFGIAGASRIVPGQEAGSEGVP